jgi:REP element-mobilizing transposase RayT
MRPKPRAALAEIALRARSRTLRLAGAIHHVVVRHPEGKPLFATPLDRTELDRQMGGLLTRHAARAHAYCWMTNHVHLAVEIEPARAEAFQCGLALALQVEACQRPPLLVDAQVYLLRLVRYVHLNPLRAGLVDDPAAYPWSGHRVYLGLPGVPWLSTDHALRLLGGDLLRASAAYRAFVAPELIAIDRESLLHVPGFPGRF